MKVYFLKKMIIKKNHIKDEFLQFKEYILYSLHQSCRKTLGDYSKVKVNKLQVLDIAKNYGLNTPKSFVITEKKSLRRWLDQPSQNIITKAIGNSVYRFSQLYGYYSYTERLTKERIECIT